jgi:predicted O-linked N-acetylglucosamine transferase (SPINDLY family)
LKKAIDNKPNYPDAHNNLGEVYRASGDIKLSIHHLQEAIKLRPHYIDALINYGNVLQDIHEYEQSLEIYNKVLRLSSQHTGALSNLANLLQQLNRHDEAITIYRKLIAIDPNYDWALGGLVYSKLNCCEWGGIGLDFVKVDEAILSGYQAIKPFDYLAVSQSAQMQFINAKQFSQCRYPAHANNPEVLVRNESTKVRLAYISADFRQHPVSQLIVNVIEMHDRSKFEVIGISIGIDDGSEIRSRINQAFDSFYDVCQQGDSEVAEFLRGLKIDIVIDLMGHTAGARTTIFAYRLAPIQVAYLGYAGTSGCDYIDYIVADEVVIPFEDEVFYTEKVKRLPNTYFPRDTTISDHDAKIMKRVDAGLPNDAFVFCSFNNHYKISPEIFEIWMRLLINVDKSVLWLSKTNEFTKQNIWTEAEKRHIPRERIIFADRTERLEDHLARHKLADLFLDTLPYNAHTTCSDALWAGLPVLTCLGSTFAGRVAASMLYAAELPELVATTLQEYENQGLRLATDQKYLETIKSKLSEKIINTSVFDAENYISNLESLYLDMMHSQTVSEH